MQQNHCCQQFLQMLGKPIAITTSAEISDNNETLRSMEIVSGDIQHLATGW
jgi:tRNA A37 threonylcarbamoyladenosine synthetase subunit TsaC/SUA5/YrdC